MDDTIRTAAEALNQLHQEDPWFSYPDAVDLLSRLEPGEVPALAAALADPSWKIRAAVARALGAYPDPAARQAILGALADPERDVRRAAVGALAGWSDPAATAALAGVLRGDPDLYTRMAAVQALAGRVDPAAAVPLIDLLVAPAGEDSLLLGEAAEALAGCGPAMALAPLSALLAHADAGVREHAAAALARLGAPAAGPLRAYAARESDAYLAAQARMAADRLDAGR